MIGVKYDPILVICVLSDVLGRRRLTIEVFNYSTIQVFSYSTTEVFNYSTIQVFSYSTIQIFSYLTIEVFNWPYRRSLRTATGACGCSRTVVGWRPWAREPLS